VRRQDDDGQRRGRAPTPYVNVTYPICKIQSHPTSDCCWRFHKDHRDEDGDSGDKGAHIASYGVDTNWYSNTGVTSHITHELQATSPMSYKPHHP
jgi:hypothetical protein